MFTVQIELNNGNKYEYPFYDLEDALWMADEQSQGGAFKSIAVMVEALKRSYPELWGDEEEQS